MDERAEPRRAVFHPEAQDEYDEILAYLEIERLTKATGTAEESFCTACLTGHYPVPVPLEDTKGVLEIDVTDSRLTDAESSDSSPRFPA